MKSLNHCKRGTLKWGDSGACGPASMNIQPGGSRQVCPSQSTLSEISEGEEQKEDCSPWNLRDGDRSGTELENVEPQAVGSSPR